MPDRNPIQAEIHCLDGSIERTEFHFAPFNCDWRPGARPRSVSSGRTISLIRLRPDGVHVYREETPRRALPNEEL
jgi:hypothetical protein